MNVPTQHSFNEASSILTVFQETTELKGSQPKYTFTKGGRLGVDYTPQNAELASSYDEAQDKHKKIAVTSA